MACLVGPEGSGNRHEAFRLPNLDEIKWLKGSQWDDCFMSSNLLVKGHKVRTPRSVTDEPAASEQSMK